MIGLMHYMSWPIFFLSLMVGTLQLGSYMMTFLKNPGLASFTKVTFKRKLNDVEKRRAWCKTCKIIRWEGVEHCEDCDVCIEDYDHHCPWTSKCIGGGNLCWFYMFLASTLGLFFYLMFTTMILIASNEEFHGSHHSHH